ncbi:MAG: hypothetical protein K2N44_16865 [Lachnospiraceae bacterium]|nr:hypothetical protein [Lachnospiraceae bacterium]
MIARKVRIDIILIKGWVWFVTELVYLVGRGKNWAVDIDNKIIEWGEKAVNRTDRKNRSPLKGVIFLAVIIVYFTAIFVDLPFANGLESYYLTEFTKIKVFCQRYEKLLSRDYEQYPPLFTQKEPKPNDSEVVVEELWKESESVYIHLNDQGKGGSNVRKEPSMNGVVVGGVNEKSEILYRQQFENDGERYWIKVYLPADEIEGWLSGNLIESEQLERIIAGSLD